MDYSENIALEIAVKKSDINEVQQLLEKGANPNYRPRTYESLLHVAVAKKNSEIIRLLVHYGSIVEPNLIKFIFNSQSFEYFVEVAVKIIKFNKNVILSQMIFKQLVYERKFKGPFALGMLMFLIGSGLPLNDYTSDSDYYTPLHYSIRARRTCFVLLLLQHGADIHKTTRLGDSCLTVAVQSNHQLMIELLLEKGAKINHQSKLAKFTPLHVACMLVKIKAIHKLLICSADVNVSDSFGNTPLQIAYNLDVQVIIVKELAKLQFKNQFICIQNLHHLHANENLRQAFEECLDELRRMKDHVVFYNFSLYDVLTMRKNRKKLILLTKNKEFVAKFKSCWDRESFRYYSQDLDNVFLEDLEKRKLLESEEENFYLIFKDHLPETAIREISYFANEALFFNTQFKHSHFIHKWDHVILNYFI